MGLFDRLFGKNRSAGRSQPSPPPPTAAGLPPARPAPSDGSSGPDPSQDPNLIRVYDGYGRELFLTRQQWRESILPANIKNAWNDPDELYGLIVAAVGDDFRSEVVPAAEHLYAIDPDRARSSVLWGVILMEEGRPDDAERVFREYLAARGDDSWILSNLAKLLLKRSDAAGADAILWRALNADPNNDHALALYVATHEERDGPSARTTLLRRTATLPGSWRALLWLAREELDAGRVGDAVAFYRQACERAPEPAPVDLLAQMSGDLGAHGHLRELINFTTPRFKPELHGVIVGNNLIKAHVETGDLDGAREVLDQLFSMNRSDWREALGYWDTEIAKARVAASEVPAGRLAVSMLSIDGPIWLAPLSPAAKLVPPKPQDELVVCVLGSSAQVARADEGVQRQLPDAAGRLSRSLPLFLAEQMFLATNARVVTLIPWIADGGGFVLAGTSWDDETAVKVAAERKPAGDYVAILHLLAQAEPWKAELRLVRTTDCARLATLSAEFPLAETGSTLPAFARQFLTILSEKTGIGLHAPPGLYRVPDGPHFPLYLLRLEQLLAVRCASMEGVPATFLSGEREIMDGNLHLCLNDPQNATTRILLAQTVRSMKKIRADIISEFDGKLARLQAENPLDPPVQEVVQQLLNE